MAKEREEKWGLMHSGSKGEERKGPSTRHVEEGAWRPESDRCGRRAATVLRGWCGQGRSDEGGSGWGDFHVGWPGKWAQLAV
jgi:hypothetical protein